MGEVPPVSVWGAWIVAGRCAPRPVHISTSLPARINGVLYYDCLTNSETALRFLLDHVGADRVVLGSDWPSGRWDPAPVAWVQGLQSLSEAEKDAILWKNLEHLLGIEPGGAPAR